MKIRFAALALALAVQGAAVAAPILDQNNPTVYGGFCYVGNLCGQSFHQNAGTISGAGFHVDPYYYAGLGTVTIGIYDAAWNGNLIASGTVSSVNSASGWVDAFWNPVEVNAETQYYMLLSATQSSLVASYSANAYGSGTAVYGGGTWPGYDLAFRTYTGALDADVPEPASLALFGLGLAGAAVARRKSAHSGK